MFVVFHFENLRLIECSVPPHPGPLPWGEGKHLAALDSLAARLKAALRLSLFVVIDCECSRFLNASFPLILALSLGERENIWLRWAYYII
jgi:hypothetical protein